MRLIQPDFPCMNLSSSHALCMSQSFFVSSEQVLGLLGNLNGAVLNQQRGLTLNLNFLSVEISISERNLGIRFLSSLLDRLVRR